MLISSSKYYTKALDAMGEFDHEPFVYSFFKLLCALYVWNYKLYKRVYRLFEKQTYKDPFDPCWINFLHMEYTSFGYKNTDNYTIIETIEENETNENDKQKQIHTDHYELYCEMHRNKRSMNVPEILFLVKMKDHFLCRTWVSSPPLPVSLCSSEEGPSNVEFLYVEYNHPSMNDPIELSIPEQFYIGGNDILSCAFILRLLEKQQSDYVYDDKYFLTVLDHKMERVHMTFHNYIHLEKDTYEVRKNSFIGRHLDFELLQSEVKGSEKTFFHAGYIRLVEIMQKFSFIIFLCMFVNSLIPEPKDTIYMVSDEHKEPEPDSDQDQDQDQEPEPESKPESFEIIDNQDI